MAVAVQVFGVRVFAQCPRVMRIPPPGAYYRPRDGLLCVSVRQDPHTLMHSSGLRVRRTLPPKKMKPITSMSFTGGLQVQHHRHQDVWEAVSPSHASTSHGQHACDPALLEDMPTKEMKGHATDYNMIEAG